MTDSDKDEIIRDCMDKLLTAKRDCMELAARLAEAAAIDYEGREVLHRDPGSDGAASALRQLARDLRAANGNS